MSQPSNYQYLSYADSTSSLKGGSAPTANGQPSAVQHMQNGAPSSFNSAGTPSSQSSRDPSRETSRDPSPTHYLHNQYRPQLSRPPMPPINGSQTVPLDSSLPMQPRAVPPRQTTTVANPQQNTSNQFGHAQLGNTSAYVPQTTQAAPATAAAAAATAAAPPPPSLTTPQSLSSNSQMEAGSQSRRTLTPTKYDFPSPQRTITVDNGAKINAESQARPHPNPQIGNSSSLQNLPNPPVARTSPQTQSQSDWRRENSFPSSMFNSSNPTQTSTNPTLTSSNPTQTSSNPIQTTTNVDSTWKNPNDDSNSNNLPSNPHPYTGQIATNSQTNASHPNSTKDISSVANNPVTMGQITNQIWRNPTNDSNSNSRTTSQSYTSNVNQNVGTSSLTQTGTSQNVNLHSPSVVGTTTQNIPSYLRQSNQQLPVNKSNLANPMVNAIRGQQTMGNQASPLMPMVNSSSQNLFATPTIGQQSNVTSQSLLYQKISGSQISQSSGINAPAHYQSFQHNAIVNQPGLSGSGMIGTNQPNPIAHVGQQNLTSQRKYPQVGYGTQLPMAGPNVVGPPPGAPMISSAPAPLPGQIPMRPPGPGAPPPPLPGQQPQSQYDNRSPYFGQMSNVPLDNMAKRYPAASYPDQMNQMNTQMGNLNVTQSGFNELWGQQSIDLLQCRNILPPEKVEPPKIKLHQEFLDSINCSSDIFRCTLTKIPESNSLLQKCRLPLGVLIHPFKDLNHLPVIQCSTIVRCRACRTYINPFVYFVDSKRWKCNLCYRVNELPEEFQFDPVTKSYGDPSRRPEVKTSTIEFIAPSEYMLRPPQPAVYLFLLDVSRLAVETGYLSVVCETIADELTKLPGDGRTQVGFIAIDSTVHFFSMPENVSQPHELIMLDVDDIFLPCPDNLIVNLKEREELIRDLLAQLPTKFIGTHDTNSALGAGLQAAFKLMSPTGGRVTVFQTCLPNLGPGALEPREDPNSRASKDVPHLNPATDFYKRLALDCSGQQIAVDLFLLNSQYSDLATLSGMCKFSGGCMYHIPLFRTNKPQHSETLEKMLRRYLTRKIGFESVMRIRCTRGLSIHTFHGNFFVRSTDLLSLPNVNPDAGFGMQVSIEENLSDVQSVCFQAALLYTSSKGERRIRVHTLCLPVSSSMSDILYSADQQGMVGLVAKMAVDRSQQSSLSDARDALINVAIDVLSAYKLSQSAAVGGLLAPGNLKLLPLYIIALIKCVAFRSGASTRLDDRVYAMCQTKALPLSQLMQMVYPDLYPVHSLDDNNSKDVDGKLCPQPPRLHLSAEKLDFRGVFLMDAGDQMYIYVGKNVDPGFCNNVFGVQAFTSIPEELYDLPELDTPESERLRNFVFGLQEEKPYYAPMQIIRDDSHFRNLFTDRLIEDRTESALSYYEFLQHLKTQVK